jgi:hypothetical protein
MSIGPGEANSMKARRTDQIILVLGYVILFSSTVILCVIASVKAY